MKRIFSILFLCFIMTFGCIYATDEKVVLKNAPDYELFYNNGKAAILSHIKSDKAISKDIIFDNGLISRYQIYLPIYIQIPADKDIARANLVKNGILVSSEKELKITNTDYGYEVNIEQVIGMPDGVGMTAETIYQNQRIYKYQIDWLYRDFLQNTTNLDVVVIREKEADEFDYIYKNMINKNYNNIYSTIMTMPNNDLSVMENYIAAKYGVLWDIDAKIMEEMRELNIAKIDFTDITSSHWAYNVVKNMAIKGILVGYEDKTFRPENNLSRAEAAQILMKTFNLTENNTSVFNDLSENHWAYDAIKKASEFIPMEGNNFKSEENITRKDFIVAIMRITKNNTNANVTSNIFSDISELNQEEISMIELANSLGIIEGYDDGTFRPNEPLTRAEACAILSRAK